MATVVVVRRADSETFQILEKWARRPGSDFTLSWDRRKNDRRRDDIPIEQRVGDRQGASAELPSNRDDARRGEEPYESRRWERRRAERRRRAPATWDMLGFLVVHPPAGRRDQ